jgi:hypothetical protein
MQLYIATSRAEILRCQYLIAKIYNEDYEVYFSEDGYDLAAKIEPWPHRYMYGTIDGEMVAAAGLYLFDTYVERFGNASEEEMDAVIAAGDPDRRYSAARKREVTKVSVRREWRRRHVGSFFFGASHARAFVQLEADEPCVLVSCGKLSIYRRILEPIGIAARTIKPFPVYKVHERYRSASDPMESRLLIPERDVPARFYDLAFPGEYEIEQYVRVP